MYTHKTEAQKWLRLSYGWVVYISLPSPQLRTLKEEREESNEMMISGDDMDVTHSSYGFQHKTYAWPSMDRRGAPKVPSRRPIGNWWLLRDGESPFLGTRVPRGCQSPSDDPIIIIQVSLIGRRVLLIMIFKDDAKVRGTLGGMH